MFRNYRELFADYLEFYRNTLLPIEPETRVLLGASKFVSVPFHNSSLWSMKRQKVLDVAGNKLQELHKYLVNGVFIDQSQAQSLAITPAVGSSRFNEDGTEIVIGSFNGLVASDLIYIMILFICMLICKKLVTGRLRSAQRLLAALRPKDRDRLDECVWRLVFYTFSSTWLIYTCFLKHQAQLYFDQEAAICEYSHEVYADEYLILLIEAAFYLHATYAIFVEDVWRRDSPLMLVHHLAAIFSLISIYATRTHKIGLAAVVLRDTCDFLLEVTKLTMCLKYQHGKTIKALERSAKVFFSIFTVAFVINQLYYYPLFCLYHAFNLVKVYQLQQAPVVIGMLTCALIFFLLDLFWFLLILRLLYRLLLPNAEVLDIREYDNQEDITTTTTTTTTNRQRVKLD